MKKLILITLLLLSSLTAIAQLQFNKTEYFTISTSVDPVATISDGFIDVVAEIEYVGFIYTKAGIEYFSALEPSYFDFHGAVGINLTNRFETVRLYSGIRLGRIFREDLSRGELFGFEAGIDYNLSNNWFIGLRTTYDYRNDGVPLGWDAFWRESSYIRIGYKFS